VYRIKVKTIEGNVLKFNNIDSYAFEGSLIVFKDSLTKTIKRFSSSNCEVEEYD
jgi:hypothetical protein